MEPPAIWRLEAQEYATEPALVSDPQGRLWIAWASRSSLEHGGQERIKVACAPAGQLPSEGLEGRAATLDCEGQAGWPALVVDDSDGVWAVWAQRPAARRAAEATLMAQRLQVHGGQVRQASEALELRRADAVGRPCGVVSAGALIVAYECTEGGSHRVEVVEVTGDEVGQSQVFDASDHALRARPSLASGGGRLALAWEAHVPGAIELRCALRLDPGPWREGPTLAAGDAFHQGPSLAWDGAGRLWIAYGSDARPDGPATLSRWVRLRCLVGRGAEMVLMETRDPPLGMALDAKGEDQSLEFPSLAIAPDGGVVIVARASHNMRAQTYGREGWGEAIALEDVMWGCRGMRIHTLVDGDVLTIAYHGRSGVQIQRRGAPSSGAPSIDRLRALGPSIPAAPEPRQEVRWGASGGAPLRAFWGDIHFHTAHSDGVGTVEEAYLRCRDRYRHDFACLTDHDGFIGRRVNDAVWRMMVDVAESFHRPEEGFATLIGIEYTGPRYPGPGHKCVYFDGPEAPVVCRWDGMAESEAILAKVKELGGIAIPHHVAWLGGDPQNHDPEVQPCWEVCSTHGQYESEMSDLDPPSFGHRLGLTEHQEDLRDHFIRRQLEAGKVFGFVGGSDGHGLMWHHGISRRADSHVTGLTGVWLEGLSRAGIMGAIRARHTWATSGLRLALGCTASGRPQGDFIPTPGREGLQVEVFFRGTAPWRRIDLLAPSAQGPTRAVATLENQSGAVECRHVLTIDSDQLRAGLGFLYVRASQEGGETAWASPWFWGR